MSEKIDILVKRPAPFWLPKMTERDEEGKVTKVLCSALMLSPGANRITKKRWELALRHPTVRVHIDVGNLKVDATAAEVAESSHTPDSINGLSSLTIPKATPWIDAATNLELLSKWRTIEVKGKNRSTLLEAIDDRTEALEEEADEDGDED